MLTLKLGELSLSTKLSAFVMAILNLTPDSFFEESRTTVANCVERALRFQNEGATLLDLGAQSTRPGHTSVTASEEKRRLIPGLKKIRASTSIPISIDTTSFEVMKAAFALGANILNDQSALSGEVSPKSTRAPISEALSKEGKSLFSAQEKSFDGAFSMARFVADSSLPVILMDSFEAKGVGAFEEVNKRLMEVTKRALGAGIKKSAIIVDPGLGFGKDFDANMALVYRAGELCGGEYPVLVGLSRKRFTKVFLESAGFEKTAQKLLGAPFISSIEDKVLLSTVVLNLLAVKNGAKFIRVHDVAPHIKALEQVA